MKNIVFIDTEISVKKKKIQDIGAIRTDGAIFHSGNPEGLNDFLAGTEYLCGHNLVHHDMKYLQPIIGIRKNFLLIDTLYLSPLLFPKKPYHRLLKDDKLQSDELNNPVNDSQKAQILFLDEVKTFEKLPEALRNIFYALLHAQEEFKGFFSYMEFTPALQSRSFLDLLRRSENPYSDSRLIEMIHSFFNGRICAHAPLLQMIRQHPVELAYALAQVNVNDSQSIFPRWILQNYPETYNMLALLRDHPCKEGCDYCRDHIDVHKALKRFFGYDSYRTYNGEPLQENAVQSAVNGESLVAIFPTGGGKSLTFQIPAMIAGENESGLTVVISPLQSLMKDQVDNLNSTGFTGAVTVNGLLSPVERAEAYRRIQDGSATLLYISPEMLRSRTIENMLQARNVVRFVVDEAHCFSAWGQDFRIDYLYIGDFIRKLQKNKGNGKTIAVSCFTATAKQKVISDIREYFKDKLNLDLKIFASTANRENLTYSVLYKKTEEEKYNALRSLIEEKNCPTIVYASRTKRTLELAAKLTRDGLPARPFNGKMDPKDKIENQEAFIKNEVRIIVATSAFGMGVDKKDIGLVVHYDISDSLESYIQEAGRAGRDTSMQAECYVLFNETDLDRHFILLNQTKLSMNEIQQVWTAIKRMTGPRKSICSSALEIARMAGWDSTTSELETRVRTAIGALENAGYIQRGQNVPHVYATGILAKNMDEAVEKISHSEFLPSEQDRLDARRIIKSLISSRSIAKAGNEDAESRIDYLADILGFKKERVIFLINAMRQDGLLADTMDMSAYILGDDTQKKSQTQLERFAKLEDFILSHITNDDVCDLNLKELNEKAEAEKIPGTSVKNIRTLLHYLTIKHYIAKQENKGANFVRVSPKIVIGEMRARYEKRILICRFILDKLYAKAAELALEEENKDARELQVPFSVVQMQNTYNASILAGKADMEDIQNALLYLNKIEAIRLEGGFLVLYNAMQIQRLEMSNKIRYKVEDYANLRNFYIQKIQQVHIVGEFANMMVRDYDAALQFVNDYFQMDYKKFITRYFEGDRAEKLSRNMTEQRYEQLFGALSEQQKRIIDDDESKHIVVVAGPGSGKTRVLVHKLASMLTLEDIKHEQLLMVTFSRAAATEFKVRLKELIGNAANFVEIKTFHSYCFDLIGKIGTLEESTDVVKQAVEKIRNGEVEPERIYKCVLVIDEAQDMDADDFELVRALMQVNDGMRVIAVGDDDQNIYEFRGSSSRFMKELITRYDARMYELVENYRSDANIVRFANAFARNIYGRLKNNEIKPHSEHAGEVVLFRHQSPFMEHPVTDNLIHNAPKGSSCIMTSTNEEALRILGLLTRKNIHAKLIQTNDGINLYNLLEVRYFLKKLPDSKSTPVILDEDWEKAKSMLQKEYATSTCLENVMNMIETFEKFNEKKYWTDLELFIKESQFEDFYPEQKGSVFVSTIHKTKGREFDEVYMMLNETETSKQEKLRALYVGFTRARKRLSIHYHQIGLLEQINLPYVKNIAVNRTYPEPDEIALQMTLRDVHLDFFIDKKSQIFKLQSGSPMEVLPYGLSASINGRPMELVRFSQSFRERLETLKNDGYTPTRAEVRYIVAWRKEDAPDETAVILPDLYLKK